MPPSVEDTNAKKKPQTIIFDLSKKEFFGPNSGFKKLHRKLKPHYKILV
jgi:hypothetical protein